MASKSKLFLRPREGLLRDSVDAEQLKQYMETFGEVEDVWIPWREEDKRYFGIAAFKDPAVAKEFVQNSPHKLDSVEILVDYMKQKIDAEVGHILTPLPNDLALTGQVSWNSYFAPQRVKDALTSIGEELDHKHLERIRNSKRVMFGDDNTSAPGIPLVMFSGPPGTGKTLAMRVIAAESGLTALKVDTVKLCKDSYLAPRLWSRVLEQISRLEGAAIFIDEAERLFGSRSDMAGYASVAVIAHKKMLEMFLNWTDGLQTRKYAAGRAPLICMATNLREHIDQAILDRTKIDVKFELPGAAQCRQWWAEHARQLTTLELFALGRLSCAVGLSFRDMWRIAESMVQVDARKQKEGGDPGQVGFSSYVASIVREVSLPSPLATLSTVNRCVWNVSTVLFLCDRLGIPGRLRARL